MKGCKRVKEMSDKYGIKNIVLGLPINMDGSHGFRAESSERFKEDLEKEYPDLKIYLQDERMTSISAHKTLHNMNIKEKNHKDSVDRLAACEILDFFLRMKGR